MRSRSSAPAEDTRTTVRQKGTLGQNGEHNTSAERWSKAERPLYKNFLFSFIKIDSVKLPLKNIVWKEGDFYVAQCLNVEVSSFGDTKDDALKNLQEALDLYFEDMPVGDALTIEQVEIVSTEMEYA